MNEQDILARLSELRKKIGDATDEGMEPEELFADMLSDAIGVLATLQACALKDYPDKKSLATLDTQALGLGYIVGLYSATQRTLRAMQPAVAKHALKGAQAAFPEGLGLSVALQDKATVAASAYKEASLVVFEAVAKRTRRYE